MMRLLPSLSTVARPHRYYRYSYSYSLALHLITFSSSSHVHTGASSVAAMTTQQQPPPPPQPQPPRPSTPTSQRLARTIVDFISDGGDGTRPPPPRICLAIAGGGSGSISSLASTPGASAALVEGIVLYDRNSFANYLRGNRSERKGSAPGSFVSREAAVELAQCALHKCMRCTPRISTAVTVGADGSGGEGGVPAVVEIERGMYTCIGVGCTSALVTARPRRGEHACHVALADSSGTVRLHDCKLTKGARSRGEEEEVVSSVVLLAVLRYLREGLKVGDDDDVLGETITSATGEILMEGERIEEETIVRSRFRAGRGEEGEPPVTSTDDADDAPHSTPSSVLSMAGARHGATRVIRGEERAVMVVPTFLRQEKLGFSSPRRSAANRVVSMTALAAHPVLPPDAIVFPGSFNPPHRGHVALANAATNALRRIRTEEEEGLEHRGDDTKNQPVSVVFEMSLTNADKPPMEADEAVRRLSHFAAIVPDSTAGGDADGDDDDGAMVMPDDWAVLLTAAPLFSQKVDILADCVASGGGRRRLAFVIGTDTMVRILNPRYYGGGSHDAMMGAVRDMGRRGVRFIVGGRLDQGGEGSGDFVSGSEELSSLPPDVRDMFTLLGEDEFRADVSSTELRKRAAAAAAAAATAGKGSGEKR